MRAEGKYRGWQEGYTEITGTIVPTNEMITL